MKEGDILAIIEEDDDEGEQAKGQDEMTVLKSQIREMMEEKRQRDDYQRRLQRKITKLNSSLADVVEEEEGLRRKQDHELRKKENENLTVKRELATRATNQENRIRESLSDVLYTKPAPSKAKQFELDTVKVTNQRFSQPLAFRIDDSTTVMKLRNNACKYWNVTPDDFILKTMANNKCSDEIRVKDCFKQGELAQLRLEEKKMEASKPTEEELKAILPKNRTGKAKARQRTPRYNAEGIETIQKHIDSYASQLRKLGGVYFLLKLRDIKPSEHCSKIKLRDMIIYTALLVLSIFVYDSRRPSGQDYWLARGAQDVFYREGVRPTVTADMYTRAIPRFLDVKLESDVWAWLMYTLPDLIWTEDHFNYGEYNGLIGDMAIRVKNVIDPVPAQRDCPENKAFVERIGGACYAWRAAGQGESRADFPAVRDYWTQTVADEGNDPQKVRGQANPGVWLSAQQSSDLYSVGALTGLIDRYDGAGYAVHYRMDARNNSKAKEQYARDMMILYENEWISRRTRAVIISFTVYNYDYDMFLANDMFFEMSPSGTVKAYTSIQPFKPRLDETRRELTETSIDVVRVVIAIYILVFVGMNERRHKIKYHKAGAWYHVSLNGITDYGIVICIWVVVLWRFIGFRSKVVAEVLDQADREYISFSQKAWAYNSIFAIEGLIMVFLSLRMLSFFRLNRTIYLLWNTMGRAFISSSFFTLMFVPAIIGFTIVLHSTYGAYMDEFSTFQITVLQFYRVVKGNLDSTRLLKLDPVWGTTYLLFFYVVITFLLMNIFVSIVVDAYYIVQVTKGGPGDEWNARKWYRWAVPGLLVNLIQAMFPGQHQYIEGG